MKNVTFRKIIIPTIASSIFLAACSNSAGNSGTDNDKEKKGTNKKEITVLENSEIPSIDSVMAQDAVSFTTLANTQEGLYRLDANQEPVEGLIDGEPIISEDQKTYKVKIKKAEWSNGDPITAHDFVTSWRRAIKKSTASPYGPYMMSGKIKNASKIIAGKMKLEELGIKALSDNELEIKLEKPIPFFKSLMAFGTFYPQPSKFLEEKGKDYATSSDNILSAGPFVIKGWDGSEDVDWTLEKNPKYWDASSVKLEKVNFNVQKDPQAAINMFDAGEADITPKLAQQGVIAQVNDDPQLLRWLEPTVFWLKMNQKNKVLGNINLRKAIQLAFDKEALVNDVLNNGSLPANYFIPTEFVKHPETGEDFRNHGEFAKFNKEEAKKLWEKGLKELGLKEVNLKYVNTDTETSKLTDAFMKGQLEANLPGLKIELRNVPFGKKLEIENKMEYDLLFSGWGPDYLDPISFSDMFITDGDNNDTGYSSKKYDKLISDAQNTLASKPNERWQALQEAERLLLEEDAVIAPIYQRAANMVVRENIKGFTYHLFGPEYSLKWVEVN